jgi:amino acid transporter
VSLISEYVTSTDISVVTSTQHQEDNTTGQPSSLRPNTLPYVPSVNTQLMTDKQWISWVCGWFAVSGWIALVATAGSLAGSLITGAISLTHENYEVERWHIFLIYLAYMLGACFINIFGLRLLPTIDRAAIFWYVPISLVKEGD